MDVLRKTDTAPVARTLEFASADGLRLSGSLLEAGVPKVLLAHGFGQTRHSWAGTQQRLALGGYGSLAWDARGHGASGRNAPDHLYKAEQFVADQIAAAATLGQAPVLVGASMGGLTGLWVQAQAPVYSALVLVDVTPRWEQAGMERIQAFTGAHADGFDSFEHAASEIANYLPHRRARKSQEQLELLLRRDDDGRLRWHWDARLLKEFVSVSHHWQDELAEAARAVRVPVLLVSGGRSDLVSHRTIAHFLELVPQASHVQLPQATHMLAGDDNDAFTDSVLGFLRAQFPSPIQRSFPGVSP
jgi:pimeloyl-ACP methyl ester carboxylesterase